MMRKWIAVLLALTLLTAASLAEELELADAASPAAADEGILDLRSLMTKGEGTEETIPLSGDDTNVELAATRLKMGVKEKYNLEPVVTPEKNAGQVRFKSSDRGVVKVSSKGVVTAKAVGKATVYATLNGETLAKCVITVKQAVDEVTLSKAELTLMQGRGYALKAKFPSDAATCALTWKSSNESVATVDGNGKVTALAAGKAKITVVTANKKRATCRLTVEKPSDTVRYRALLIGEEGFEKICTRNRGDVKLMTDMLRSVRGPAGGRYTITRKYDLDKAGVLSAIAETFADADKDDVSLFFIATHGDSTSSGKNAGALAMIPKSGSRSEYLLIEELAEALRGVPGKVIVILESCGAGAAVYDPEVQENRSGASGSKLKRYETAAKVFDNAVIQAFTNADPGLVVDGNDRVVGEGDVAANTGELRVRSKFYVLAASRYQENSYGTEGGPWNYFTKWLTDGVGTSGSMPADYNANNVVSLRELFKYISIVGDNHPMNTGYGTYYQHVQVYPVNCTYNLFAR